MSGDVLTPALVDALVSPEGEVFCRLLRRFYYEELQSGRITPSVTGTERSLLQRAIDLGLLRATGSSGQLRFTDLGYEIGNVSKEYSNWLDAGRRLPEGVGESDIRGKRVLDVGCGFGRYVLGFAMHGADVYGIDFQQNYLRLSRVFARHQQLPPTRVARSRAEHLPFRSGSFDLVFCRLVLNYVDGIDHTLGEFVRVLTPRGMLILVVEPLALRLHQLRTTNWRHNSAAVAFTLFGLLNTLLLHAGGRQVVLRARGRMHARHSPAWPTAQWLAKRLASHGFVPIHGTELGDPQRPGLFSGQLA